MELVECPISTCTKRSRSRIVIKFPPGFWSSCIDVCESVGMQEIDLIILTHGQGDIAGKRINQLPGGRGGSSGKAVHLSIRMQLIQIAVPICRNGHRRWLIIEPGPAC